jgi:selenide,water dikinase
MASMGFVPAGAYRNRAYVEPNLHWAREIPLPLQDILFDPQTSGGLLIAAAEKDAEALLRSLKEESGFAAKVGYVTENGPKPLIVE